MDVFLIEILNKIGYWGVFLLIFIENIFPPIPSEVVLLFGGFMTTYTEHNVFLVILFATIGSYAGACVLYFFGRLLNKERIYKFIGSKIGRLLRLKEEHFDKANSWFERYEYKAVLICRCVPIVRSVISIPAGISKMPFGMFSLLTILGSSVWNTVLVFIGYFSGSAWEKYVKYFGWYSKIVLVIFIVVAIVAFLIFMKKRKR